ncbi:Heat shock protein, related, partial [Eimeria necatrix]
RAVPKALQDRRIFSLDLLNLSAGTSMRGEFERRMKDIIAYLQRHKKEVILFVDEIHTLVGAGKTAGSSDATQILKVPLARGEIVLVGATTLEEYKLHIEKDAAFCRRFQNIVVEAPSKEKALSRGSRLGCSQLLLPQPLLLPQQQLQQQQQQQQQQQRGVPAAILQRVRPHYEQFHQLEIPEEVLEAVTNLADQYVKQRAFPDKALDLLDESCSWKRVSHNKQINLLQKRRAQLKKHAQQEEEEELKKVEEELAALEALTARVVGQDRAVKAVADALAIQRAGLSPKNKPLGTFLFLGSSGVGKTELAKAVAEEMFDSDKNLIRLDMVEYQEAHSISRLIGPPPGYMGNDEGGQLTEAVRQKPHSVVLFDEVENAHKNLWSLLLPVGLCGLCSAQALQAKAAAIRRESLFAFFMFLQL